ncbi:MAG: hypothetical protein PHN88_06300 [Ignavibacteria bacterium]|nr:hypothetical protein [Ignavibacteria bacterium]
MKNIKSLLIIFILLMNIQVKGQTEWNYLSLPVNPVSIKFSSPYTGWVVGNSGNSVKILKTDNRGESWTEIKSVNLITSSYAYYPRPSIALIDDNKGFLYYGNKIYKTLDGGSNWYAPSEFSGLNNQQGMQTIKFYNANT